MESPPSTPPARGARNGSWPALGLDNLVLQPAARLHAQWHEGLRNEAHQRLSHGLVQFSDRSDVTDDDIGGGGGGAAAPGARPPLGAQDARPQASGPAPWQAFGAQPPFGASPGASFKRSVSEASLDEHADLTAHVSGGDAARERKHSRVHAASPPSPSTPPQQQHRQPGWAWDHGAARWSPGDATTPFDAFAPGPRPRHAPPQSLLTSSEHQHHGGSSAADAATGSFGVPPPPPNHAYWAPPLGHRAHHHHHHHHHAPPPPPPGSPPSPWASPLGVPRVSTAPSTFQGLSETLNSSAHRNLEAVRAALQNAQASIQETASNCQANLQSLTSMLQAAGGGSPPPGPAGQGVGNGGGGGGAAPANPLHAALLNTRALMAWTLTNAGDPFGGALVPWHHVIPRVIGRGGSAVSSTLARRLQQQQQRGGGGDNAGGGDQQQQQLQQQQQQTAAAEAALSAAAAAHAQALPLVVSPGRANREDGARAGGGGGALLDFVTPLEQHVNGLGGLQLPDFLFGGGGSKPPMSLREPGRQVAIVTTASLPWLTGTSVNPLLRAAYLSTDGARRVTLVLPWLSPADQQRVFPAGVQFDSPEQQEEYVRAWARQRTGLECDFKVAFYPSRYAAEKGSILPVGDITQVIPDGEADVAVLEEPEHLNWYHHGTRWTDKFRHVVGVMHTNYLDYARREENGGVKEQLLRHINAWVTRIHCHKVIKLSDAVQPLPREDTMFVHGVSPAFLKVGAAKAQQARQRAADADAALHAGGDAPMEGVSPAAPSPPPAFAPAPEPVFHKGAYFLGKVLWAKGYTELLDRLNEHVARTGQQVEVDVYGSGPDLKAVEEEASRRRLALHFNGARDHADASLQDYKVFINPSLSDVVATTTAEALAMGKWVVCAEHPSNHFFKRFPNCLIYRDSEEFSQCLHKALREDPRPLSPSQLHDLTWEAATERFLDVADPTPSKGLAAPLEAGMDKALHALHNTLTGVEFLRVAAGAGARTRDLPLRVTDYQPDANDVGGLFDNAQRAKKSWEAAGGTPGGVGGGAGAPQGSPAAAAAGAAAVVRVKSGGGEGTAVKA